MHYVSSRWIAGIAFAATLIGFAVGYEQGFHHGSHQRPPAVVEPADDAAACPAILTADVDGDSL